MADKPLEKILKVEQPVLEVDADHVEVTQAPPAEDVLRVKQPLTAKEDASILMTEGQRRTSWKWEETQAGLAIMAARSSIYTAVVLSLSPLAAGAFEPKFAALLLPVADKAFLFLVTTAASITAYYFLRTNSHKVGGVELGDKGR